MKLIIISGPPAVGKMTVGRALSEITGYKLLYNHMTLELVNTFFDFGTEPFDRLDKTIRFSIFREVAASDISGLIFTMVWDHDYTEDNDYIDEIEQIFNAHDAEIYFVELNATLEERLRRNRNPERLLAKPSKRDLSMSEKSLLQFESDCRMQSHPEEFPGRKVLRIDNTTLSPNKLAREIKQHFDL